MKPKQSNFSTKQSWFTASNVVLKRYKDNVDTGLVFGTPLNTLLVTISKNGFLLIRLTRVISPEEDSVNFSQVFPVEFFSLNSIQIIQTWTNVNGIESNDSDSKIPNDLYTCRKYHELRTSFKVCLSL